MMNKRIKELRIQACKWASENVPVAKYENASDEKFAELIILECAEVSFKHWEQHKGCSAHFSIREHFGVEW
jgi:hypothetical protein